MTLIWNCGSTAAMEGMGRPGPYGDDPSIGDFTSLLRTFTTISGLLRVLLGLGLAAGMSPAFALIEQCVDRNPEGLYECEYQPQVLDDLVYNVPGPCRATSYSRSEGIVMQEWSDHCTENLVVCEGPHLAKTGAYEMWLESNVSYWAPGMKLWERAPIAVSGMHVCGYDPKCQCTFEMTAYVHRRREAGCSPGWLRRREGDQDFCYRARRKTCTTPNPIAIGSGEKLLFETDFTPATVGGIEFRRRYSSFTLGSGSQESLGAKWNVFGPHWRHNYQAEVVGNVGGSADTVLVNRAGSQSYFVRGSTLGDGRTAWLPRGNGAQPGLYSRPLGGGGVRWEFYSSDNVLDIFENGALTVRASHDGQVQFLTWREDGLLGQVADAFGRRIVLEYDTGRLVGVGLPDQSRIEFTFAQPTSWNDQIPLDTTAAYYNLVRVTYPGQGIRDYHYSEADHIYLGVAIPGALTGITDESRQRYSDYYYSNSGVAYQSTIGGLVTHSVSGSSVTDPLGTTRSVFSTTVNGEQRVSGSNQPGGSGCSASSSSITYDARGNVESETDFAGHKTCHGYDAVSNLEAIRIEGLGSGTNCATALSSPPAPTAANPARVINTAWHPDWRLEVKRSEPKKLTIWVYNGQPDPTAGNATASCAPGAALLPDGKPIAVLCRKVEQATTDATGASGFAATLTGSPRTWTWAYNGYGQVLTATDALGHTTTYSYYADTSADHTLGDLAAVTNAAGHVTTYPRYDRNGRLLEMRDPNGLVTTQTYSPRGWLRTRQVGNQLTTYDYDPVGQLIRVTSPDGSWIGYQYDAAHRLTDVYDQAGNRISYTLDAAGNRLKEEVKDPGGTLARTQSRVYDALSRVQNLIQPSTQVTP